MKPQQPQSMLEFQKMFSSEENCAAYLEQTRWPDGFVCPTCDTSDQAHRIATRPRILRCRNCHAEISLTSGTVMHATRMPLQIWFFGAYLVTTQTPGISAIQFQRQLGISRYETAFQMLHKLRTGLVRPHRDPIGKSWPVEVDETLVGGRTQGEGRGTHHKLIVSGAIEVRPQASKSRNKSLKSHCAGRLRLQQVPNRGVASLDEFVKSNVVKGAEVRSDGWRGYDHLADLGYNHRPLSIIGDPERVEAHLPMIHIAFSNLKAWLIGTHHGVSQKHLQAYLDEFVFRFNRRFYPMTAFPTALGIGTHMEGATYREFYDGKRDQSH